MYPRIPWELNVDPLGSAEPTSGTTALDEGELSALCSVLHPCYAIQGCGPMWGHLLMHDVREHK
jgi:hypothetical protein